MTALSRSVARRAAQQQHSLTHSLPDWGPGRSPALHAQMRCCRCYLLLLLLLLMACSGLHFAHDWSSFAELQPACWDESVVSTVS